MADRGRWGMDRLADTRRGDLDWMRISLVLVGFLCLCARLSSTLSRPAGSTEALPAFDLVVAVVDLWLMPLFFVISAGAVRHALDRQDPPSFVVAKVLRLFVPLVFGALARTLPLSFLERATGAGSEAFPGMDQWYLLVLFVFSLLLLPLFRALRGPAGRRFTSRFSALASLPGALYLLGVLPAVPCVLLRPTGVPGMLVFGGWNLGFYLGLFLLGYLFFSTSELPQAIARSRFFSLAIGILLAIVLRILPPEASAAIRAMAGWSLTLAVLGFGLRIFANAPRPPVFLHEAVLPFFLLSQPVILAVGFCLRSWSTGPALRFAALALVSFVGTAGLSEGIRRVGLLRFLFGLAPREKIAGRSHGIQNLAPRGGPTRLSAGILREEDGTRTADHSGGEK